jgi:hypothetical protein
MLNNYQHTVSCVQLMHKPSVTSVLKKKNFSQRTI